MSFFTQGYETFPADGSKRVTELTVKLIVKDVAGDVGVTDIMLQRGKISTEWVGHPSEIKWTTNE